MRRFLCVLALGVSLTALAAPAEAQLHRGAAADRWMRDDHYDPAGPPSLGVGFAAIAALVVAGAIGLVLLGGPKAGEGVRPRSAPVGWRGVDLAVVRVALDGELPEILGARPARTELGLDVVALRAVTSGLRRMRSRWTHVGGASHKPMSEAMAGGLFDVAVEEACTAVEVPMTDGGSYRTMTDGGVFVATLVVAATTEIRDFPPHDPDAALRAIRALGEISKPAIVRASLVWTRVPRSAIGERPLALEAVR